jgi:molybdopterin-biosynthesis enzyme MoeA-like protein
MSSKKNIFDKLSLKKKVELNKHNQVSNKLNTESINNSSLLEQLKKLQEGNNQEPLGLKSASYLKSATWYSQKLSEEISLKENKQKFLVQEIETIQKKIAKEQQNIKKAKEKAFAKRKMEKNELETRLESMIPKINKHH